MPVISTIKNKIDNFHDRGNLIVWENLEYSADPLDPTVGESVTYSGSADRSVQIVGDFGTGGTLVIEGSNDGVNYSTLRDHLGNLLSFTTSDIRSIDQITQFLRPRVTSGDGATNLSVHLHVRRLAP